MKLKRLWIKEFKNLYNFDLNFEQNNGVTVLIGNNGSGKSNVLEAISAIFYDLYNMRNKQRKRIKISEYELEYIFDDKHIIFEKNDENYIFKYYLSNTEERPIDLFKLEEYLPSNIIMIYSGEDIKIKQQYYEPFRRKFQAELRDSQKIPTLPKLLYLDSFFWTIGLLVLFKKDIEFCKRILKNDNLENIEISFDFNTDFINETDIFINLISNREENIKLKLEDYLNKEINLNEKDLFVYLAGVVGQRKKIKKLMIINNDIDIINLSEGEKKQILIKVALEILADEKTLILMDEPDSNIHIANKIQIKEILESYQNRETILTTHSPTLTHCFNDNNIYMLKDGEIEDKHKQEIFHEITDGIWNYQQDSVFLSSSKEIILLVEGKHDKIHIEEAFKRLKDDYQDLEFDVFSVEGANNIKQLLTGIKSSFEMFDKKKIYIGIFDCDKKGKDIVGTNAKRKKYASLGKSKHFYYMYLPFQNYNENFEIENMYNELKLKEAYQQAILEINKPITKDILEEMAKNILAENCKNFENEDFEHFKKLFDLIREIKEK